MSTISTPALVLTGGGRQGTAVYDNPSVTNNNHASVYVVFADSTYEQLPRGSITVQSGGPWVEGNWSRSMNTVAQLLISESGQRVSLNNDLQNNSSLECDYVITGAPATLSVAVEGVINGGSVGVLDSYSGTTNTVRTISLNSVTYDSFRVIASWTGGFNVGVAVTAKSSGPGQTSF